MELPLQQSTVHPLQGLRQSVFSQERGKNRFKNKGRNCSWHGEWTRIGRDSLPVRLRRQRREMVELKSELERELEWELGWELEWELELSHSRAAGR